MTTATIKLMAIFSFLLHSTFALTAIYGEDERLNYSEVKNKEYLDLSRSIVGLVSIEDLNIQSSGDSYIISKKEAKTLKKAKNLCEGEKFGEEYPLAFCSGFLVKDKDTIGTAGHCVETKKDCENTLIVFDFTDKTAIGNGSYKIKKENVYKCSDLITQNLDYQKDFILGELEHDFALLKINREVKDRTPLKVSSNSFEKSVGTPLLLIGHPTGLPMKIVDKGDITNNDYLTYFRTNLDSFAGNSGSAVLNRETSEVEGILVRGYNTNLNEFRKFNDEKCNRINKVAYDHGMTEVHRIDLVPSLGKKDLRDSLTKIIKERLKKLKNETDYNYGVLHYIQERLDNNKDAKLKEDTDTRESAIREFTKMQERTKSALFYLSTLDEEITKLKIANTDQLTIKDFREIEVQEALNNAISTDMYYAVRAYKNLSLKYQDFDHSADPREKRCFNSFVGNKLFWWTITNEELPYNLYRDDCHQMNYNKNFISSKVQKYDIRDAKTAHPKYENTRLLFKTLNQEPINYTNSYNYGCNVKIGQEISDLKIEDVESSIIFTLECDEKMSFIVSFRNLSRDFKKYKEDAKKVLKAYFIPRDIPNKESETYKKIYKKAFGNNKQIKGTITFKDGKITIKKSTFLGFGKKAINFSIPLK